MLSNEEEVDLIDKLQLHPAGHERWLHHLYRCKAKKVKTQVEAAATATAVKRKKQ